MPQQQFLDFRRSAFAIQLLVLTCCWPRGEGGCAYGGRCYEPAPPGRAPPCAAPGLTYCLDLDTYPVDVIRHLVELGQYDITTLLSDESREEFSASYPPRHASYGPPAPSGHPYAYGPNSLPSVDGVTLVDEPIDIPKPGFNPYSFKQGYYNQGGHPPPVHQSYLPPKVSNYHANFTKTTKIQGYHSSSPTNYWGPPGGAKHPALYEPELHKYYQGAPAASAHYYNQNFHSNYYNHGQNNWSRFQAPAVTPYNPSEWWRYTNPNARSSDVQIDGSISYAVGGGANSVSGAEGDGRHKVRRREVLSESPHETLSDARRPLETLHETLSDPQRPREALQETFGNARRPLETLSGRQALQLALAAARPRTRRQAADGPAEQLCQTRSQYVTPKAALNKQGNWRYVVNMGEQMSQLVKSELCVSQECSGLCQLPLGYRSRCEQKYVQKRLVALDNSGQKLYTDVFWFPSCCQCMIVSNN